MRLRHCLLIGATFWFSTAASFGATLSAGAAKADITNYDAGPVNDPLFAKALVLRGEATTLVIISVDAVAIGEIGHIGNDYLPYVRKHLERDLGISPQQVLVNASHCHGVVHPDVAARTVQAVKEAMARLEPVKLGAGRGHEDRIMENRRIRLKDGSTADSRHAYALPPDEVMAEVGPVDPNIGVLRLDTLAGKPLAALYNFACHPIMGVPGGKNTADITGFASQVIEANLGEGAVALFLQGCGGDINPAGYKAVGYPRDAEPLGNRLGLSTLKALREISTTETDQIRVINEKLTLPRVDSAQRIAALEAERDRLLNALQGTSLNLKTFVPLYLRYNLHKEFPSAYAHQYLQEEQLGQDGLRQLDQENRRNLDKYVQNIHTMEALTRVQANLALLKMHQEGPAELEVEVMGVRIGDFTLITFPGELTVQIGLNIKAMRPDEHLFVAGYTNGYIYYAPTTEQLQNPGYAQEDCDTLLDPAWQQLFERKAGQLLEKL